MENFSESNLIGRGSYGSVYKGKLTQAKIQVAIMVFDLEMRFADKSFVSECEMSRDIRHRNLLPILTACSTIDNTGNDFKALIYEFMHNGNLDTWLHHRRSCLAPKGLSLVQRISIAVNIADALTYLHHDCGRPIVHCDLKPTNILLDDDMNAYLGDFGIALLQGDVYSFGIVLLEMLIGKRPTNSMFEDGLSIVSLMERDFSHNVFCNIDAHLQEECKGFIQSRAQTEHEVCRCLLSLVQVDLSCTRPFPRERMNMREVAVNLHSVRRVMSKGPSINPVDVYSFRIYGDANWKKTN
ncbi:putative LRR receptor-like serine/threonine-protein kinase [Dichanthelium oligosanthes]|uniref:Putative LRR receptor-like serine/threonine-protein kinase n=1 Tax=Dichanthelium oligosanthes TaxID=888268 RepID=A0A1E5UZP4_9POAL|nr:putative LRR receptor-like serine/threonine-protein kinase [Dichanthelium oligosanthes]